MLSTSRRLSYHLHEGAPPSFLTMVVNNERPVRLEMTWRRGGGPGGATTGGFPEELLKDSDYAKITVLHVAHYCRRFSKRGHSLANKACKAVADDCGGRRFWLAQDLN